MNQSLWVAKTGLDAQQTRMSLISNNLANVNTTGYKRGRASFQDLMYQTVRQPGAQTSQQTQSPSGLMVGTGTQVVSTEKLFTQGNLLQTNNPFDLAINGRGFFEVQLPDGSAAYTRDGSFQVDSQGQLVTASGYPLQPGINIPPNAQSVTIGSDGTVSVQLAGEAAPQQVGSVTVADFINPAGLQAKGENLFAETASSGAPQTGAPGQSGLGLLIQGSLESSNVNVVEELVNMIETQRAYEMNSKAISTTDQMLAYVSNNL
jgi:flagellar basal-body rod protein FlgG